MTIYIVVLHFAMYISSLSSWNAIPVASLKVGNLEIDVAGLRYFVSPVTRSDVHTLHKGKSLNDIASLYPLSTSQQDVRIVYQVSIHPHT